MICWIYKLFEIAVELIPAIRNQKLNLQFIYITAIADKKISVFCISKVLRSTLQSAVQIKVSST